MKQLTPRRVPPVDGLEVTDHTPPLNCPTTESDALLSCPTAAHVVTLGHDTAYKTPATEGEAATDQLVPLNVSTSAWDVRSMPTAAQNVTFGHDTPYRLPLVAGPVETDQVVLFKVSIRG